MCALSASVVSQFWPALSSKSGRPLLPALFIVVANLTSTEATNCNLDSNFNLNRFSNVHKGYTMDLSWCSILCSQCKSGVHPQASKLKLCFFCIVQCFLWVFRPAPSCAPTFLLSGCFARWQRQRPSLPWSFSKRPATNIGRGQRRRGRRGIVGSLLALIRNTQRSFSVPSSAPIRTARGGSGSPTLIACSTRGG